MRFNVNLKRRKEKLAALREDGQHFPFVPQYFFVVKGVSDLPSARRAGLCFIGRPPLKTNRGQEAGILAAVPVSPQLNLPNVSAQQIKSFRSRDTDDNQQAADVGRASLGEQEGKKEEGNANRQPLKAFRGEMEAVHKCLCKQEVEYLEPATHKSHMEPSFASSPS